VKEDIHVNGYNETSNDGVTESVMSPGDEGLEDGVVAKETIQKSFFEEAKYFFSDKGMPSYPCMSLLFAF
jgi:hypothetical protein